MHCSLRTLSEVAKHMFDDLWESETIQKPNGLKRMNRAFTDEETDLINYIKSEALEIFPVDMRSDDRDNNWIKRHCYIAGALEVLNERSKRLVEKRKAEKETSKGRSYRGRSKGKS